MLRRESSRHRWTVALLAAGAMSLAQLDRQIIAGIAPHLIESLHLSRAQFGWLGSGFALSYLVAAPLAGRLVERHGAKWTLLIGMVAWSIVAATQGIATSFASLLGIRLLLGVAESPAFPAATATVRTVLRRSERGIGTGLLFTGASVGVAVAGVLGPRLATYGLRYAFFGSAALALVWLPFWAITAPASAPHRPEQAAASVPWRSRAVQRQVISVLAAAPALTFVTLWLSQCLVARCGVSKRDVGSYLWLPPLVFDACAMVAGSLAGVLDRRAERNGHPNSSRNSLMFVGALLVACLALLNCSKSPWWVTICGSVGQGGAAFMYVVGTADVMKRLRVVGIAGGVTVAAQSLVQIIVNPVIGALVDRLHSFSLVSILLGLVAIPGSILWILYPVEPVPSAQPGGDPIETSGDSHD